MNRDSKLLDTDIEINELPDSSEQEKTVKSLCGTELTEIQRKSIERFRSFGFTREEAELLVLHY